MGRAMRSVTRKPALRDLRERTRMMNFAALVLAALAPPIPAIAGDVATFEPLGFSEDGSVFAYQQYGIQDGSGFPYAEIFFLDLAADRFLEPSPVRVRLDDESAAVADAMAKARADAADLFAAHDPGARPGQAVVDNPSTELSAPGDHVKFLARPIFPPIDKPVELRLETYPVSGPEACEGIVQTFGYRLMRLGVSGGDQTQLLHEDEAIPLSRKCPTDYRIRQVRLASTPSGSFAAVAVIAVESVGFEGPDIRYIAEPVPMD